MVVLKEVKELLTLKNVVSKRARNIKLEDLSIISNAALVIEKGRIIWVGETKKLPSNFKKSKSISYKGRTILPAFLECHTHSLFAGSRSDEFEMRNQGLSYQQIADKGGGIRSTVNHTRKIKDNILLKIGEQRLQEFLRQGVTTVEIKSGYGLDLKSEIKLLKIANKLNKTPFRIIPTYLGPHAVPPEHSNVEFYMNEVLTEQLPQIAKMKLTRRGDIFIDQGYFTIENGKRYAKALKDLGWDLVVHADQMKRTGATQLAVDLGARTADHVLQINGNDIQSLARSETTAVLLPTADLYLKMNYPQARKLIDAGARVALATDYNPGSSPTQDISLVGVLARLEMKMSLPEVLAAYTVGAAYALNLQDELGSLEVGKAADFIVLDTNWRELFYQAGHNLVTEVWSRGQRVVDNLKLSTIKKLKKS